MKNSFKVFGKSLVLVVICLLLSACGEAKQNEQLTDTEKREDEDVQKSSEADPMVVPKDQTARDWSTYFKGMSYTKSYKGIPDTNPIMTQRFGADPYAMVYGDRVYFYMTADAFEYDASGEVKENTYSKIQTLNVVSTDDMMNFTDHGSIAVAGAEGAAKWAHNSWAPAAAWKKIDGKDQFFLYFADNGGGIGVLVADSPTGPFTDPLGKALISRDVPNCDSVLWLFDPAVLVDDDGRAYLYFGGGVPEGKVADPGTARVVELGEDMISIKGEPIPIDVPYLFEDSGIHKAGNKYYYTYCSNWQVDEAGTEKYGIHNAEIVSLVSDSPMGPFTFKERILENPGKLCGLYGNNHHCVFCFRNRWYIAYHSRALEKAMGVEHGYRCTNIDEFTMGEDGTIGTIRQTTNGREQLKYVNPYEVNSAVTMAMMAGLDTVSYTAQDHTDMLLTGIDSGDYMKVQGVDFGDTAPKAVQGVFRVTGDVNEFSVVRVSVDAPGGQVIGYLPITMLEEQDDNGFAGCTMQVPENVTGVHDLYFVFSGSGYEMKSWKFEPGEDTTRQDSSETTQEDNGIVLYCPKEVTETVTGREYGSIEHIIYQSVTTGLERGANVLLPADYTEDKTYPVLYFLHGIFGDEYSFVNDGNLHIKEVVGNLTADGLAREMIVVFPNMYATTDPKLQPGFTDDAIAPYDNFIHDLVNDLIPYIESHYSVSNEKKDRAILGFSMGGRETLYIGLNRPDLFSAVGAISPAPGVVACEDKFMKHKGQMKEDEVRFADPDQIPDFLMVCCGSIDSVVGKFPLSYHELLDQNGVDHIWYEIPGVEHDDKAIRSGLYNFLIRWKE